MSVEETSNPWEEVIRELKPHIPKIIRLGKRRDTPRSFARWSASVSKRFDENPEDAEYAITLWQMEAESRSIDFDLEEEEVLKPFYFTGLSKTLSAYAVRFGLQLPSLLEFARKTTTGQDGELRRPYRSELDDLYLRTQEDLHLLRAAILQRQVPAESTPPVGQAQPQPVPPTRTGGKPAKRRRMSRDEAEGAIEQFFRQHPTLIRNYRGKGLHALIMKKTGVSHGALSKSKKYKEVKARLSGRSPAKLRRARIPSEMLEQVGKEDAELQQLIAQQAEDAASNKVY